MNDQSPGKNVVGPGSDQTRDLLITSQMCIQLSHRGFQLNNGTIAIMMPNMQYNHQKVWKKITIKSLPYTLRKHAYSNIWRILPPKNENFPMKNSDIFLISAQNTDCRYSLEPPRWGCSNEYPQSMFLSRNKKNNVYPCKPQFYYIKVGFKGVKIL